MALKKKRKVRKAAKKAVKKPVKKTAKKAVRKKPVLKKRAVVKKEGKLIGLITHYFPHVQAAVIKLKARWQWGKR